MGQYLSKTIPKNVLKPSSSATSNSLPKIPLSKEDLAYLENLRKLQLPLSFSNAPPTPSAINSKDKISSNFKNDGRLVNSVENGAPCDTKSGPHRNECTVDDLRHLLASDHNAAPTYQSLAPCLKARWDEEAFLSFSSSYRIIS